MVQKSYVPYGSDVSAGTYRCEVDTTQVTLLSLESMETGWLSGSAQVQRGLQCIEHEHWHFPYATLNWVFRALLRGRNLIYRTAVVRDPYAW